MKKKKFTEIRIMQILEHEESEVSVSEPYRNHLSERLGHDGRPQGIVPV